MINTFTVSSANPRSGALSQRIIEILKQLQPHTEHWTPGCFYVYDLIEQHTVNSSDSVATLLGYTADAVHQMGVLGLASLIHPDDLDRVAQYYQRFATLPAGAISIHYRMKRADGNWCWLHSQETPLVQAIDGFPLQILGLIQILTPRSIRNPKNHGNGVQFNLANA